LSEIPASEWTWINDIADRFERAWKHGAGPLIEDYLAAVDESRWPALLEELLRVETELRRGEGRKGPRNCAKKLGKGQSPQNVKPLIGNPRVTTPFGRAGPAAEAILAWGEVTLKAKRRQQDQTLAD
jgi:hypothetical protein